MAERLTKNEKREQAREQARIRNLQEKKRAKRKSLFIRLTVLFSVLAVIGIVISIILASNKPAVAQINPKNMLSNGVVFDGTVSDIVRTEAIPKKGEFVPTVPSEDKVNVAVYLDYTCPYCKIFEQSQSEVLKQYVEKGDIVLEFLPISFLSRYSGIATNAMACLATHQPEKWWEGNETLFAMQPEESVAQSYTPERAKKFVKNTLKPLKLNDKANTCVNDMPYLDWAGYATNTALNGPIPNSDSPKVEGTPYVIIDGKVHRSDFQNDPGALSKAIEAAKKAKAS